jgi:hypothetical protein
MCTQGRDLTETIIAAGLARLMGDFDMRWCALVPGGWRGKRTSGFLSLLLRQKLIGVLLTYLGTTVRQDLLEDLCQVAVA